MSTHGGKRKGAGPKTKISKGLKKHKQLTITIPAELYKKLISIQDNRSMSATVSKVLESAFQA